MLRVGLLAICQTLRMGLGLLMPFAICQMLRMGLGLLTRARAILASCFHVFDDLEIDLQDKLEWWF